MEIRINITHMGSYCTSIEADDMLNVLTCSTVHTYIIMLCMHMCICKLNVCESDNVHRRHNNELQPD